VYAQKVREDANIFWLPWRRRRVRPHDSATRIRRGGGTNGNQNCVTAGNQESNGQSCDPTKGEFKQKQRGFERRVRQSVWKLPSRTASPCRKKKRSTILHKGGGGTLQWKKGHKSKHFKPRERKNRKRPLTRTIRSNSKDHEEHRIGKIDYTKMETWKEPPESVNEKPENRVKSQVGTHFQRIGGEGTTKSFDATFQNLKAGYGGVPKGEWGPLKESVYVT